MTDCAPASLTLTTIAQALAGYDSATLAAWYNDLGGWAWPVDFPLAPPAGFVPGAGGHAQYVLLKPIMHILQQLSSDEDRSKAWWTGKLGRTETEWQEWWDREHGTQDPDAPDAA